MKILAHAQAAAPPSTAREKQDGDVIVTVVARNEAAKARAKERLAGCAGFAHREWAERWVPLNLGDALIRLYPERAAR